MNRNEADIRYTWDLRSLFASQEAFDAQLDTSKAQLQALCARKGHISDTIDTYIAFLNDQETFERGLEDLVVYARMCTDVEPKDMQNQQNLAAANNLLQQAQLDLTFVSLELIRHADTISTYLRGHCSIFVVFSVLNNRLRMFLISVGGICLCLQYTSIIVS